MPFTLRPTDLPALGAFALGLVLLGRGMADLRRDAIPHVLAVRRRRSEALGRSMAVLTADAALLVATFWAAAAIARPTALWTVAACAGLLVVAWMGAMTVVATRAEADGRVTPTEPDPGWLERRVAAHRTAPVRSALLVILWLWAWWPTLTTVSR
jgi:hypothetical protein